MMTSGSELITRVVLPDRLALIVRGELCVAYNPHANVWHLIDEVVGEVLRWIRAKRPRHDLPALLAQRFDINPADVDRRLRAVVGWCVLRKLMYLDEAPEDLAVTLPENPLATVYWICTQACNLRCTYCYQEALVARSGELSTDEALDLVDQVVETGASTFVFTGGEPFSRRDLRQVAAYSKSRGLKTNVITNGHYVTERTVGWVADTFDLVTISLDHMRPEHHDRHRGKGSWARASTAIRLLTEAGAQVDVNSVLSRAALSDLEGVLRIRELGIGQQKIVPQFPMGRGHDSQADALRDDQLLGLNDRISRLLEIRPVTPAPAPSREGNYGRKGTTRIHCGAGLSEVSVDPEGWVYPCKLLQYAQYKGSNVRERRLEETYGADPVLRAARHQTADRLEPCKSCLVQRHCGGGCRGIHTSFSGAYADSSPLFCAFIRRSFEAEVWRGSHQQLPPRRNQFHRRIRNLPIVAVSNGQAST